MRRCEIDAQILQGEIEAVQEAILAVDQKVDELEEEAEAETPAGDEGAGEALVAPTIDLAQTVGRLEAELETCKQEIASLRSQASAAEMMAQAAMTSPEPEPEPEPIPEVLEVEAEPEPESASDEPRPKSWLERLLLVR